MNYSIGSSMQQTMEQERKAMRSGQKRERVPSVSKGVSGLRVVGGQAALKGN